MNKTIITFGTFDLLHKGHINILERASKLGNKLIVGISTDVLNYKKKKKNAIYNQYDRQQLISSLKCVTETFFEESLEKKREYILKYKADILVMGDDWKGKFDIYNDICDVIYFPRTNDVSTTEIVEDVIQRNLVNYICMNNEEAKKLYNFFSIVLKIFEKYNLLYFAIGGTLLGAIRNKNIIPWNYDIDIAIFNDDINILNFYLFKEELHNNNLKLEKVETGYTILNGNFKLNIYIMDYVSDNIITFSSETARKIWPKRIIDKKDLYPLKKYDFGPLKINGLNNPHNFFINCDFGDNYMTHGKIMQNYRNNKHTIIINFLIEKKLDIINTPEIIFKSYNL